MDAKDRRLSRRLTEEILNISRAAVAVRKNRRFPFCLARTARSARRWARGCFQ